MRRILLAALLSTMTVPVVSSSTAGATVPRRTGTPILHVHQSIINPVVHALSMYAAAAHVTIDHLRAEWQRVAICEVGGNWSMTGGTYSGIGFLNTTWQRFGGTRYAPLAGEATRDQQILVGMKVTGGRVPDQYGCYPW